VNVNAPDPLSLQSKVAGLERRVRSLEKQTVGEVQPERTPLTLFALYADALLGSFDLSEVSADLWNHATLCLDEEALLELGRQTKDPFPWKPLLLVLDHLFVHGFDTEQAAKHLLDIAQSLLKIQGLDRIRPEDLLGWSRNGLSAL